jgi:hypothetical protein
MNNNNSGNPVFTQNYVKYLKQKIKSKPLSASGKEAILTAIDRTKNKQATQNLGRRIDVRA